MKTASVAISLLFAACMAVLSACGGSEEELPPIASPAATEEATRTSPAASPTLPLETRAEREALLKSMALTLEDLPSGFTLDEENFMTNEEAAKDYPDGEEQGLADYARWGRLLGYEATYSTEVSLATLMTGGTIAIWVETTIFEDSNGAEESMARNKERLSDPEERARLVEKNKKENPDWEDVEFQPMSFAQVGEDTAAFQVTGKISDPELELEADVMAQYVAVRRGRGIGLVAAGAIQGPPSIEELEAMARKLDQRMKEALE